MVKTSGVSVTAQQGHSDRCHRCGGLMVPEKVLELGSFDWRCVCCGERIDPVILAHRKTGVARAEAEKLFASHEKPRLN